MVDLLEIHECEKTIIEVGNLDSAQKSLATGFEEFYSRKSLVGFFDKFQQFRMNREVGADSGQQPLFLFPGHHIGESLWLYIEG